MPEMQAIPKDAPVTKAWNAYKATEEYANSLNWCADPAHAEDSLWALFYAGFFSCAVRVTHQNTAVSDVVFERIQQVEREGWTTDHEDLSDAGELVRAAICYAAPFSFEAIPGGGRALVPGPWPWADDWWKPKDERTNLVKAAALLIAEIERLDRRVAQSTGRSPKSRSSSVKIADVKRSLTR